MPNNDEEFIEAIAGLRAEGKTRNQISVELSLTLSRVKRIISKFGVKPRKTKQAEIEARRKYKHEPSRRADATEGVGLMEQVKQVLGTRMGIDHRGYLLDGRPCSSDRLVRESGLIYKHKKPVQT